MDWELGGHGHEQGQKFGHGQNQNLRLEHGFGHENFPDENQ